ncbi:hypothetical protein H0H87_009382 [Tephrocybe sp. NHM501043]|nr:hypothetical protein H0H87_009382 [Tephrocybe sp. NHM501043]
MAGETIMAITYGLDVQAENDPYIATAAQGVHPLAAAAVPGAFLVDVMPILKYVPYWMPFAGFQRKARRWRKLALDMINLPYAAAKRNITVSAIVSCILGLLLNPAALKKAQDEIDRVVGTAQLPTFDDVDLLPYITAITKETLRWRDVTPIGTKKQPNCLKFIFWDRAMLHDENIYPNPFDFNPDRFMKDGKLDPNAKDPMHAAFGFGRR